MAKLQELSSAEELSKLSGICLLHLNAPWSPQCEQMSKVIAELAKDLAFSNVSFCTLEAEKSPAFCMKHNVVAVPTFLFLRGGKVEGRVDGAHAAALGKKLRELAAVAEPSGRDVSNEAAGEPLEKRLGALLNSAPVILFMKGSPDEPKCGFSRKMIEILRGQGVSFTTFDILTDPEVRQGLKEYSKWPTYPQLYAKGELVGGLDVVQELAENEELLDQLPKQLTLDERMKELINRAKIMLFMKGSPQEPRCGFSKTTVQILGEVGAEYDTFDILKDNEIRQGLKEFSKWPTFPQLYVNGQFIGGLDILKELQEDGSLAETINV